MINHCFEALIAAIYKALLHIFLIYSAISKKKALFCNGKLVEFTFIGKNSKQNGISSIFFRQRKNQI